MRTSRTRYEDEIIFAILSNMFNYVLQHGMCHDWNTNRMRPLDKKDKKQESGAM